ncbi:MAG: SIS domain-containing protein, partial [Bdellovibrionota bacterium]
MENFSRNFLKETIAIIEKLDTDSIEATAKGLAMVRENRGRLFILGVGGSAGHAGHAVNDFRKICGIESYAPTDNVSELTARVNDEGWDTCFSEWLKVSRLRAGDGVLVFSVGGGNRDKNVSVNLV